MLRQIPITLPWSFENALGYPRGFRWVAFFWEPCGDEAMYDDGYCSGDGNPWGFLQFIDHPSVKPWLKDYNLGSSEDEAIYWLLCDLESREVFVGERSEVKDCLFSEVKKHAPHLTEQVTPIRISPEEISELLTNIREKMQQVPAPSTEEILEQMRRGAEAIKKMVRELG